MLRGAPHLSQTLGSDDLSDVTGATSPVEGISGVVEVPVIEGDWLELTADVTGFPPFTVSEFTSGM
jgi:hypothetical protein